MFRNAEGYADPTAGAAFANIGREQKRQQKAADYTRTIVTRRPKVYVVSKFADDITGNVKLARRYCRFVASKERIPVASHLMYPQFLNDNNPKERELGLLFGLALLRSCAEVWCFGTDISAGMKQELEEAARQHKTVRFFTTEMEEINEVTG